MFVVGAEVTLANGAKGPVTIYANNVALGGTFMGDVNVAAAGHVALAEGTVIHGALKYQSPEEASVPTSAQVVGGVTYRCLAYDDPPGARGDERPDYDAHNCPGVP